MTICQNLSTYFNLFLHDSLLLKNLNCHVGAMTGSQLFLKTVKQIVEIEHLPKEFLDKVQSVVHLTVYM